MKTTLAAFLQQKIEAPDLACCHCIQECFDGSCPFEPAFQQYDRFRDNHASRHRPAGNRVKSRKFETSKRFNKISNFRPSCAFLTFLYFFGFSRSSALFLTCLYFLGFSVLSELFCTLRACLSLWAFYAIRTFRHLSCSAACRLFALFCAFSRLSLLFVFVGFSRFPALSERFSTYRVFRLFDYSCYAALFDLYQVFMRKS